MIITSSSPGESSPPKSINFSASSVPILQLGVSGKGMDEQQLSAVSTNLRRPSLVTVPGTVLPYPHGSQQAQISAIMDLVRMQAKGVSPGDLLQAMTAQNVVTPSGTVKIGQSRWSI